MAKPETVVKEEIKNYIDSAGGVYAAWYAGIAENPRSRLFEDHSVDENNGYWIYRECYTSDSARRVEKYLIDLGLDGDIGGGGPNSAFVYTYKKTTYTNN